MQELLVFIIVGVGRLREDQLIFVETRETVSAVGNGRNKTLNTATCGDLTPYSDIRTKKTRGAVPPCTLKCSVFVFAEMSCFFVFF